ncbi:MAG TPA: Mur ligase family protein, partial [Coxiellaceae bacterium]|nr:Mur ligase family protein [Coxiellaceae bacterium]
MLQSLDSWLDYLNKLHPTTIDLSLERIRPLAEAMGLVRFACPVICVAGTNGKGSTVRFLECAYLAAGFEVAAYTSPHILHFNERLRINDEVLSDALWLDAFKHIEVERGETTLSFFEFTTLAALWLCQQHTLDVIILEVGLGGRLDAVNVVDNDLAIITTIDLDHQEYLGYTREAIAKEKAGVFKENGLAVCGDLDIPLTVFEEAEHKNVSLYTLNRDYFYETYANSWVWMSAGARYDHLPLPELNIQDAATSLMAIELLQKKRAVKKKLIPQ